MNYRFYAENAAARLRETSPRRGLSALLSGYRAVFAASLIALILAVATETAVAFVLRDVVDAAMSASSGGKPSGTLVFFAEKGLGATFTAAGIFIVILAVARGLFSFVAGRWGARVAEGIARDVREILFDHLQRLPFHYHDRTRTGELVQRATSDVDSVRRFYGELVPGISRIAFLFLLNFAAIAALNLRLALLSSLVVPAVAGVSVFFFKKIFTAFDQYQDTDAKSSAVLQESITGVRVVKAFARQDFEIAKYEEANFERYTAGKRIVTLHSLYWPTAHALCAFQTLGGWFLAVSMMFAGTMSLGTFVAYTGMLGGLIWPLQNLGRLVAQLSTSAVSYTRLSEIIREEKETLGDESEDFRYSEHRPRGNLTFEDVWFAYDESQSDDEPRWALKGISFEAPAGSRIALLGAPGSGKSTLVNLIPRFYEPTRGRILLDGKSLSDYPKTELRAAVGVVEQQPFLFSMTIGENIAYGAKRELNQEEIRTAAAAAAIHDSITNFPEGYKTMVGERGVTLSGGQKQRLAIARALVKDPSILILDDSTSAVDAETEDTIRAALDRRLRGRTTFVVAHKVRTLMDADLILVFKDGEIIERGDHVTLMDADGFYRRAFDLQTKIEEDLEKELRDERSVS